MSKITTDTINNSEVLFELIQEENLTGEDVYRMFVNWHGAQLCTKDFMEDLRDCEGYNLPEDEEEED